MFTSVLNFAEGALMLVGVALSFWRAASSLALVLGLEPQVDVGVGLVACAVTALLPGLLLVAAGLIRRQNARPVAA